jgi:hypothetical protein
MGTSLIALFTLEVLFFVGSILSIFVFKISRRALILFSPLVATGVLGMALFILTIKYQVTGALRVFLMLAGAAPGAMFISIILHNFISALIMKIIKKDFEEAVFFILAIFGCPAAFLVGTVGTIALMIKNAVVR